MITPRLATVVHIFASLLLVGALTSCATTGARIQARINEKPAVFAALTKQQQKDIKWGYVRPGFTPDMVYFAFGKPERIITTQDSGTYIWVFLDHTAINQDVALASAMRSAGSSGNPAAINHDSNYGGKLSTEKEFPAPKQSGSDIYSVVDADGKSNMPTIWVAFQNGTVVNVRSVNPSGPSDKSGSLGG